MKTIPINLANHYASPTTNLSWALKVTRKDTTVYAFTSDMVDTEIAGITYLASQGLDVSNIEISAGFAVSNLELTTLDDGTIFNRPDILAGKWYNAKFELFRYNSLAPSDGVDTILVGTLGEVEMRNGSIMVELRGLQQYLQQPIGSVSSKTCRARFGDALCTKSIATFTVTGSITSVTSQQIFTDTTRAEAADWFSEGSVTFTSGSAEGLTSKIKTHAAGGVITLTLPILLQLSVGDTYSMVAGCRKRLTEDCNTKFSNAINFQGEPHLPGVDALSS